MNAYRINGVTSNFFAPTPRTAWVTVILAESEQEARDHWTLSKEADFMGEKRVITSCEQLGADEALKFKVQHLAMSNTPAVLRAMLSVITGVDGLMFT
jgi:hypothetical protein